MEKNPQIELLDKLVELVRSGQEHNKKMLALHEARIKNNRDSFEGLSLLVNNQSRVINVMREVLIKLWEDRFGSEGVGIPEGMAN